jgi:hypothetical protein
MLEILLKMRIVVFLGETEAAIEGSSRLSVKIKVNLDASTLVLESGHSDLYCKHIPW